MFGSKIKLDKTLIDRATRVADIAGYSSVEEFITHVVERELDQIESEGVDEEAIRHKLKGLGYI